MRAGAHALPLRSRDDVHLIPSALQRFPHVTSLDVTDCDELGDEGLAARAALPNHDA